MTDERDVYHLHAPQDLEAETEVDIAIRAERDRLGNVIDKTYAQSAEVDSHIDDMDNPHHVTKAQIGLENADNTSDLDKPISNAMQTALNEKAKLIRVDHEYDLPDQGDANAMYFASIDKKMFIWQVDSYAQLSVPIYSYDVVSSLKLGELVYPCFMLGPDASSMYLMQQQRIRQSLKYRYFYNAFFGNKLYQASGINYNQNTVEYFFDENDPFEFATEDELDEKEDKVICESTDSQEVAFTMHPNHDVVLTSDVTQDATLILPSSIALGDMSMLTLMNATSNVVLSIDNQTSMQLKILNGTIVKSTLAFSVTGKKRIFMRCDGTQVEVNYIEEI